MRQPFSNMAAKNVFTYSFEMSITYFFIHYRRLVLQNFNMDTNKHNIIVTEAFRAALLRVKKSQQVKKEVKERALYAGLNKVDAD